MVSEAEGLGRLLRGGVRRERTVGARVLGVGHGIVRAVQAGRGGENELVYAVNARVLEQVERARGVRVEVDPRVDDRVADAGAGGEVDDCIDGGGGRIAKQRVERRAVRDVQALEMEPVGGEQPIEAPLLEPDVVGIVQVVDTEDGVTPFEEQLGDS